MYRYTHWLTFNAQNNRLSAVTGCIHLATVLKPNMEILQSLGTLIHSRNLIFKEKVINIKTMAKSTNPGQLQETTGDYSLTMSLIFFKLS